jgi:DNA ligase (NAD+)
MGMEGFGEKILTSLVTHKLLREPADFYRLRMDDLLALDRMGTTLAQKLLDQVNNARTATLETFITALGFQEIGPTVAETLADHFHDLEKLRHATLEDLLSIHGIGVSIAESLISGFNRHVAEIDALLKEVRVVRKAARAKVDINHPLFEKSVVFTGKMSHLERKEAQKRVRSVGGKTPSSVTKETDLLVVGDEGSALLGEFAKSTKQKEAEKLRDAGAAIRIISESEFMKMF